MLYLKGTADYSIAYSRTRTGTSALRQQPAAAEEEGEERAAEAQEHLLEVFSDSDWAGDKQNRKSVSCAMFYLDGAYFYSYSRTQKSIALSSAEAEYMALTGAASEGIGLHAAARFLTGKRVQLKAYTDSSACRRITNRQGVGRVKHLQIRLLWLQAAIREGKLTVHAVGTKENTADLGTKPLSTRRVKYLLNMIGMCSSEGRVGEQERAEEDKAQVVRRLEKIMKNKSSMLFALSSFLLQRSEAANIPIAAAQGPSLEEAQKGSMSLLEVVVAILMAAVAAYFVYNLESKKGKEGERKKRNQRSSSEDEDSSESSEKESKKKKKDKRKKRTESSETEEEREAEAKREREKSEASAAQVTFNVDATNAETKKEEERVKEAEKLRKKLEEVKERLEEEKEALEREKASFEEKVKKLLAKQKETKEREEKAKEAEEKATAKEERYKELEKTLDERENNVTAKEQELAKREKAAEKTERRAQERTVGYDTEREEYAKKYIDNAKKDLEREIAVLKQEEKVRNQKLDDLEYNYKSLKDDAAYFKEYSQELDKAMVEAKEKLRKQKEKIQKLKETLGATLSGSEGQLDEEQEEPAASPQCKPAEVPAEVPEEVQEPEEKKEKKPRGAPRKKPENLDSPSTHEDKNDPDVTEFATLGYIYGNIISERLSIEPPEKTRREAVESTMPR